MPNPNPHHARLAKKRARKPGDMAAVLRMLWQALLEAEEVLLHAEEPELTLKAVHAISQSAGQYVKLLESGELEARLLAVEQAMKAHP